MLLALGIFIVQVVRHYVEVLYATTLIVRSMLSVGLALVLFVSTGDPFFGVVLLSGPDRCRLERVVSYLLDRRDAMAQGATA